MPGRFSPVPTPADLQPVTFEDYSLEVRNCRPGDCHVRLGADDISRFHKEVNWNGADWREQSARVWRDVLARYAAAYLSNGRKALPDYVNKREALSVASEVSLLISDYGFVSSYSPELRPICATSGRIRRRGRSTCSTGRGRTSGSGQSSASPTRSSFRSAGRRHRR
jgi:hypothetical protein